MYVPSSPEQLPEAEELTVSDFHENVAQLLIEILTTQPTRSDLRWTLLETYHSSGRAADFIKQAKAYRRYQHAADEERWPAIVRMGRALAPDCPLFKSGGNADLHLLFEHDDAAGQTGAPPPPAASKHRRFYEAVDQKRLSDALSRIATGYNGIRKSIAFRRQLIEEMHAKLGRPTPLIPAPRFIGLPSNMELFLKREDQRGQADYRLHNAIGQVLLAQKLGARRVVAGTSSGRHGIAVATAAGHYGLACTIHTCAGGLGPVSTSRLEELGADIRAIPVSATPNLEPRQEALLDWLDHADSSFFVCGLSGGAAPYPTIVFDLMSLIGEEVARQLSVQTQTPLRALIANGMGGMETFGLINPFLQVPSVEIFLALQSHADASPSRARRVLAREYNWLAASSRAQDFRVADALANAVAKSALIDHALRLDAADGITLAAALAVARRMNSGGSIVALISGA